MINKIHIIIFIIIALAIFLLYNYKENFAGALLQLYAKGPQDYYLTGDNELSYYYRHNRPYFGRYYPRHFIYPSIWNMPTSFKGRNSAPYLALTPERYYLY